MNAIFWDMRQLLLCSLDSHNAVLIRAVLGKVQGICTALDRCLSLLVLTLTLELVPSGPKLVRRFLVATAVREQFAILLARVISLLEGRSKSNAIFNWWSD
jgi:hypothetical protein